MRTITISALISALVLVFVGAADALEPPARRGPRGPVGPAGSSGSSGWTSDGGTNHTDQFVEVGTGWTGNDAGRLNAGSLRVWGPIEGRGKPSTVSRGDEHGYCLMGSIDVNEGALWCTQDPTVPGDNNWSIVGNGSDTSISGRDYTHGSVYGREGWLLDRVFGLDTTPRMSINRSLAIAGGLVVNDDPGDGGSGVVYASWDGGVALTVGSHVTDGGATASALFYGDVTAEGRTIAAAGTLTKGGFNVPNDANGHAVCLNYPTCSRWLGDDGINIIVYTAGAGALSINDTTAIVSMPFGFTTAAASNKGSVALVTGSKTITVLSGAICTCGLEVGTVWPKCVVVATTLTITGTGTDRVTYACL